LQHLPIACVFKQDQSAFTLGADADEPYAWSRDVLVLRPILAKFKWHPSNRDKLLTVWRRNFEVSPALCFTNYKVIAACGPPPQVGHNQSTTAHRPHGPHTVRPPPPPAPARIGGPPGRGHVDACPRMPT
jgi:hypothetical protein